MFIQATEILKKPVVAADIKQPVGVIGKIIIDPENGQVLGFLVLKLFQKPKIVLSQDVLDLTQGGLVINAENSLVLPKEVIKIDTLLRQRMEILNARAKTQAGRNLGKVEDYLIETETASVVKFYLRGGLFSPSLILPMDKVVKIERNRVIFSDDLMEGEKTAEAYVQ